MLIEKNWDKSKLKSHLMGKNPRERRIFLYLELKQMWNYSTDVDVELLPQYAYLNFDS